MIINKTLDEITENRHNGTGHRFERSDEAAGGLLGFKFREISLKRLEKKMSTITPKAVLCFLKLEQAV